MVSATRTSVRISSFVVLIFAACLTGCPHPKVTRYSPQVLPPTQSIEVFHSIPSRSYSEIGEVRMEGTEEPTEEILAKAKELGADAVYFMKPEDTGRVSGFRIIYRHRAIAIKWKGEK
jgi:hypothetical protein